MTTYHFSEEMEEMCFKLSEAYKVLGDGYMHIFYSAASAGFRVKKSQMTIREGSEFINEEKADVFLRTTELLKKVNKKACRKLDKEASA